MTSTVPVSMPARTIPASEAGPQLEAIVDAVAETGEPVVIEHDGRPEAVLISLADYRLLHSLRVREKEQRREEAIARLRAIGEAYEAANPELFQAPVIDEAERERRAGILEELRALRAESLARNTDLSPEEADELGVRFSREMIDDMVADGRISFERDQR